MKQLIYQNSIELEQYLKKYLVANQLNQIIRITLKQLFEKEEALLSDQGLIFERNLLLLDCEKQQITKQQMIKLENATSSIRLINCQNAQIEQIIVPPFDETKKNNLIETLKINAPQKEQLKNFEDIIELLNVIKKIKILEKNITTRAVDQLINEAMNNNQESKTIYSLKEKYQIFWIIKKYSAKDDLEIAKIIDINPRRVYYFRKEAKKLTLKLIEKRLNILYELLSHYRYGKISNELINLKILKLEEKWNTNGI